ncbi:unnamed protein product, partial [marine sediment metagenome]
VFVFLAGFILVEDLPFLAGSAFLMLGESLVLVFSADSILGDVFLLVLVSFLMAAGFPGLLSFFGATSFLLEVIFFNNLKNCL